MDKPPGHDPPKGYRIVRLEAFTDGKNVVLPPRLEQTMVEVPAAFERVTLVAYKNAMEIIVPSQLGVMIDPDDDNNCVYDCSLMGCSESEHIVARFSVR